MCGQVGYWGNSSNSHSHPTGAGTAGPLVMLHTTPPYASLSTTRVYRRHPAPHRAHRREDTMPPRRSTAHPTDAYTAKPLAILRHTPLVHRALHCTRYCERPRHSLPAHASAKSKTSTRTSTAGAGRKDGSRASAESERQDISSSEHCVGCLIFQGASGWRNVSDEEGRRRNGRGGRRNRQRHPPHRAQNLGEATTATMCSPTSGTGRVE
ncbi:hypothetical protein B0H14DRAFT_2700413 [Mycena olivaceomarginata]|nr:hypothetical protein B0H14DRAFT_2700413 [Mycena olivaceomarginata]